MEWTAEAVLERLESDPELRSQDLIREQALAQHRKLSTIQREFSLFVTDPKYSARFHQLLDLERADLTFGLPEPDPRDKKSIWIHAFLKSRQQIVAAATAGVSMMEVEGWLNPRSPNYDESFVERHKEATLRVLSQLEDDIETARQLAIASGDGKALAMISTRALESLNSKKWGRSRLEIAGSVDHRHLLPSGTAEELAARTGRLLSDGDGEVIDAESEELPS